ncbi:hypothetical protein E3E14_12670 [Streptomyces sp. ICN441]|uniref:hypothetical protein n=1 Tax=Streptomyces sp. ICN441 TaxID=2558286 RepID=UPI00106B57A9|nr:hypothetical protein [Streptomyces sp. ICN441]TFE51508.1 hypothetical protein E3E14_12670 [Streptomyces sp. ICN441]
MRTSAARRTAVAVTAVSLALLTACSGGGTNEGGDKGKAGSPAAAEPAAKALTATELEKLALAEGEVKGHKVTKAGPEDEVPGGQVVADKAECKPLADAVAAVPLGDAKATVKRKVVEEPKKKDDAAADLGDLGDLTDEDVEEALNSAFDLTATMVSVSSYDGKGAEEAVAGLRTAARACAGGFGMTMGTDKSKIVKVEEIKVSGGQEATAWALLSEQEGEKMPHKVVLVRQGATLASFSSFNLGSIASGKDFPLPTAVIDAQAAKLG